jgi:hypothetical protein
MAGDCANSKSASDGKWQGRSIGRMAESSKSQQLKACVLILGTDSGATRALARILGALGCALPASWSNTEAQEEGAQGLTRVDELNAKLLASAGTSWDDVAPFYEDWRQSPAAKAYLKHGVAALEQEYGEAPLLVLEGAGLSRLVPFWTEVLIRFGCTAKPILMMRNPLEFPELAAGAGNYSQALGQMIWLREALEAERSTRGSPRFHTSFERLLQGWETVVQDAQEALQLTFPKAIQTIEFDVPPLPSGDPRQSRESQARAMTSPLVPDWVRETYKILNGWAMSEEMSAHFPMLDQIRSDFDAASRAFSRMLRAERHDRIELTTRAARCEALEAKLAVLAEKMAEERGTLERALERSLQENQALEISLEELRSAAAADVEAVQAKVAADLEALQVEVAAGRAQADLDLGEAKKMLQEQKRRNTLLDAELFEAKERLEEARAEIAATRARRKEMARVIERRNAQIHTLYQEMATLERHMMRWSLSWHAKRLWRRAARLRLALNGKSKPAGQPA